MYTLNEIRLIFLRCKDYEELEKACDGFVSIIQDGDLNETEMQFTKMQAHVRFRQLKC